MSAKWWGLIVAVFVSAVLISGTIWFALRENRNTYEQDKDACAQRGGVWIADSGYCIGSYEDWLP